MSRNGLVPLASPRPGRLVGARPDPATETVRVSHG
jgi:hypothetical protein